MFIVLITTFVIFFAFKVIQTYRADTIDIDEMIKKASTNITSFNQKEDIIFESSSLDQNKNKREMYEDFLAKLQLDPHLNHFLLYCWYYKIKIISKKHLWSLIIGTLSLERFLIINGLKSKDKVWELVENKYEDIHEIKVYLNKNIHILNNTKKKNK